MIKLILLLMIIFVFFQIMSKFGNKKWFKYYILAGLFIINPVVFLLVLMIWWAVNKSGKHSIYNDCNSECDSDHRVITVTQD